MGDFVGRGAAGHAHAAHVQRMVPDDRALAGLGLAEGNAELLCEGAELVVRLGIAHAAAADEHGLLRIADDLGGLLDGDVGGRTALDAPDALLEERLRIVVGLALHVLRQRDAHRAGVGGIGQHAKRAHHGAHQLLGAHDAIPVAADGAERVVGGQRQVVHLLDLLQHRVGLAAGVHVAGQDQHGDVVGGGGGGGGDHVGRAGADGRGDGHDLLALHVLGERHGHMGLSLLVLALIDLQPLGLLQQRLAESDHVAVAGQHEHAADKGLLHIVIGHILVLEEAHQRLGHGQSDGVHSSPSIWKMWSLASASHSHACSGSSMRVLRHGSPGRWRMPHM